MGLMWALANLLVSVGSMPAELAAEPPKGQATQSSELNPPKSPDVTDRPWETFAIDEPEITESSGLAASSVANVFWTHNDSGDKARIFAVSPKYGPLGQWLLEGVSARDWEDIAAYTVNDQRWLVTADCGGAGGVRDSIDLYRFREPILHPDHPPGKIQRIKNDHIFHIKVNYPDGAMDCEAIAIDHQRDQILLFAKSALPWVGVYQIDLQHSDHFGPELQNADAGKQGNRRSRECRAKRIGNLAIPMLTGADIDPQSKALVLTNYFQAFVYSADASTDMAERLKQVPRPIPLPPLRQIEACAFGIDQSLWITSEGSPMIMAHHRHPIAASAPESPHD